MAKGGKGTLLAGLTRKNPKGVDDGSPKRPSASVDKDAVRGSVAASPRTLGPRTA